jgi:lipopolysaccharide transport system ATP-binding protein
MGKMGEVAKGGRTVLFVSHNMGAITRLCQHAVWLDRGRVRMADEVERVVSAYLSSGIEAEGERSWDELSAPGNDKMRLRGVRVVDAAGNIGSTLDIRRSFGVEVEYDVLQPLPHVRVAIRLLTEEGTVVFTSADSSDRSWRGEVRYPGRYVSRCEIPGDFLNAGLYGLVVSADIPFVEVLFMEENVVAFHVEQTGGSGGDYPERWPGVVCPALPWSIQVQEAHAV